MNRLAPVLLVALLLAPSALAAQAEPVAKDGSAVYPFLEVNIAGAAGLRRLVLGFEAQCVDANSARALVAPQVREAVLLHLRAKSVAELSTAAGKERLRQELVALLNKNLGAPRVVRIFYLQFVII